MPTLWIAIHICLMLGSGVSAQVTPDKYDALIDRFAPIFIPDGGEGEAIVEPSVYAEGSRILSPRMPQGPQRVGNTIVVGKPGRSWMSAPNGSEVWTAAELRDRLRSDRRFAFMSSAMEMSPRSDRHRTPHKNPNARKNGAGVFGHVTELGDSRYSLKYILFLAWNETAYVGGEGNHEGDWICIDLQVRADSLESARIEYAIFHNHGRQILADASELAISDSGQPHVYLERGTNEPWPNKGVRGFGGYPELGLRVTKHFGISDGDSSEHKVVREHEGNGVPYDTRGKVRNLASDTSLSTWLVNNYKGQWGEYDDDDIKWIHGYDTTNPYAPPHNPKMWERAFAMYRLEFKPPIYGLRVPAFQDVSSLPDHYRSDPTNSPLWHRFDSNGKHIE